MSCLASMMAERSFHGVRACAVGGLPAEPAQIAAALGLLPEQFGPTRGGAIQADIDLPSGFWRVWPERGIGMWVGRDSGQTTPLQRWQPGVALDLLQTVLRLGEHDAWLYEGQLHDEAGWTPALPLKAIYDTLRSDQGRFDALSGEFGDSAGRSTTAFISRFGFVETVGPTQAVRWLSIAYGLNGD